MFVFSHRTCSAKAGGQTRRGVEVVDLDGLDISSPVADDDQLLAVNEALDKFAAVDERKAELVKLRYFVGLNFEEAAAALGIAVSPDSGLVASSNLGGQVRFFDPAKGELIETLHGHLNAVFDIAFSPDGRQLISSNGGREAIKLWDVVTRQELLTLVGTGSFLGARWSADGDVILTDAPWQARRAPSWSEINAAEAKEKVEAMQKMGAHHFGFWWQSTAATPLSSAREHLKVFRTADRTGWACGALRQGARMRLTMTPRHGHGP